MVTIGQNGNWYIDGVDTGNPSRGKDGDRGLSVTVEIGANGNWYIDGEDTGVPASGADGRNGTQWCIGENGNWYYYDNETGAWEDSGKPSRGETGETGPAGDSGTGLSAYELWVQEVLKGNIFKEGVVWDKDKISMADFWEYLCGRDGKDGNDGKDGEDLSGVPQPVIQEGIYNVIAGYYNIAHHEYVNWGTGGVTYTVYGPDAQHVPAGVEVTNMPKMNPNLVFVTDDNGQFVVAKEQLPQNSHNSIEIYGRPTVLVGGRDQNVATATHVPCAMQIRLVVKDVAFNETQAPYKFSSTAIFLQLERKKDAGSAWEEIPSWIGAAAGMSYVRTYDSDHRLVDEVPVQEYRTSDILKNYRFNVPRRIKSDGHYKYSSDEEYDKSIEWYGVGDRHYYMKVSVGSRSDSKVCYGETPEADAWIEDVPLRPVPYCTRLDLSYEIDNKNMLVKAYFDQQAMQNIIDKVDVIYEAKFSNQQLAGSYNTWVPTILDNPSSRANMQIISVKESGVGSVNTNRSQFHSIPQLLTSGNPGYIAMEHVLNGSKLQICANGLFSATFFSFDIGAIHVEGTGDNAAFTLEQNPALLDNIKVSNIK